MSFKQVSFTVIVGLVVGICLNFSTMKSVFFTEVLSAFIIVCLLLRILRMYIIYRPIEDNVLINDDRIEAVNITKIMVTTCYYAGTVTLAQLAFRPIAGLNISDLFYFSSVFFLFFLMIKEGKITYYVYNRWMGIGLVIFLIGATLAIFNAVAPLESMARVFRVVFIIVIWFTLGTKILNHESKIHKVLTLWLCSVAFNGFIAMLQLRIDVPLTINHYGRMSSFTGHVSDLGGMSSVAWVPALVMATTSKGKKSIFFYIVLILIGLGAMLSGSVSGMITIFVGTFIWLLLSRLNFKFLFIITVLIAAISIVISVQTEKGYVTPLSRFESTTSMDANDSTSTMLSRFETYKSAWNQIERNPFVGVGYDGKSNKTDTGFPVHNLYLAAWYEGGIFALVGILIITGTILYLGIQSMRKAPSKLHYNLSLALFISFICSIVFGMTSPVLYQRYVWIPAALILPLYKLAVDYGKENRDTKSKKVKHKL
ncbi:O-antigen ligase family protein [Priestia megaterium]|uniref:O-antigen ligase family protein n=1 Tax=Priestia megaterium TaxID=1404 RepID=UPI00301BC19E